VDSAAADAEIVLVGAEALAGVGMGRVSFDLTLPQLAPTLLDEAGVAGAARLALTRALDRKDAAAVAEHGGALAQLLTDLLLVAGPVAPALEMLEAARLPPLAAALCARLRQTVQAILHQAPDTRLTLDPIEFRGFRYHTGVCVTVFAPGRHEELGRGGRYVSGDGEPAAGLTLYPDAMLRALPPRATRRRAYLPWNTPRGQGAALRGSGFATLPALADGPDPADEARRLGCTHILRDGVAVPLTTES
jgi:ATP phosphoribosyltransferase regulatory subunit